MKQDILFISDLHLSAEKTQITHRFLCFLKNQASRARAVYILGDLFDAWVGDDDNTPPNKTVKKQLKRLSDAGTQIYLQTGNRDFLLGAQFCLETGITLLDDYAVIELNGVNTLLTHGDLLCTDDIPYQEFRKKSHSQAWQQRVLSKPLIIRLLAARWYRLRSYLHKNKQSSEIMDVNQQTVHELMKKNNCLRLIHGHTHRPGLHHFELDGKPAQRFVLADWKKNAGQLLRWNQDGYSTEVF